MVSSPSFLHSAALVLCIVFLRSSLPPSTSCSSSVIFTPRVWLFMSFMPLFSFSPLVSFCTLRRFIFPFCNCAWLSSVFHFSCSPPSVLRFSSFPPLSIFIFLLSLFPWVSLLCLSLSISSASLLLSVCVSSFFRVLQPQILLSFPHFVHLFLLLLFLLLLFH